MSIGRTSGLSDRFSASSRCWRRSARASSTCVRTIVSSRAFSHGFWTKSRAPRRIASTATSTLPQAVITTTGSVAIVRAELRQQVEPFLARGRVARVVEIHQHGVEFVGVDRLENRRRRVRPTRSGSPRL